MMMATINLSPVRVIASFIVLQFLMVCLAQSAALPTETKAVVKPIIQTDEESETFGDIVMEFDMRMGRTVDKSYQLLESHCQLGESDLQKLDDAFSRLTHGRGMMVHKTSDEIKFGAAVNPMDSSDAIGKPTCPYSRRLVYLGENAYPHRLMNATCDCDDCQNEDSALDYMNLGLPRTKACQPQFYHVPIIRYHSLRIQTAPCVIHDFTVEFVKITTGCTCVHLPV